MSVNSFENYPMNWKPDAARLTAPKHISLMKMLEEDIQNGTLKAGMKLPPQRELADFLNVGLSTVTRAFRLCAQKGLISAAVGQGTYVSADAAAEPVMLSGNGNTHTIEMGAVIPAVSENARVKRCMERLLKSPDSLKLFSYGMTEGTKSQREAGAHWIQKSGLPADSRQIILAPGGQNALVASLRVFMERGDKIGTDPLTYSGMKTAAKLLGIHLVPIQTQDNEITEEGVRYAVQNENIKGLYVIPDYQNPTTHTMSLERRKQIAQAAQEHGLFIIEDGIYSLLRETLIPPIASFAPEHTIYLSSLSKTVSAGLRTAFIYAPERYRQELVAVLNSFHIANSPLLAATAASLIEEGIADEIISERKKNIIERNLIINETLKGADISGELTCPLRYIRLPEYFTGKSFEICAQQADVQVYGAERFAVGKKPADKAIRISVTTPATTADLAEGALRLRRLLLPETQYNPLQL